MKDGFVKVKETRINMEANAKLLKKKRIAHLGGKMTKSNLEGPKLPPDDFVYNIMKDMDTRNVISYKQSQEGMIKKKDLSLNKEYSTSQDSYCNKQVKKILPKRSFPLMKKCQTSLKYLEKNRCIPKPRAHVGFVPKPLAKPVCRTIQEASKFESGNSRKVTKPKQIQSKAYSKVLQSNYTSKISKPKSHENTGSISFTNKDELGCHLSSTDDDDAAFESFVQKVNEENNDSTDSDSRLIIRRKKSRNKSKQKKKKQRSKSFSDDENQDHVPKMTSIPLSDSSESQSIDAFEDVNESLKPKTDSPIRVQKRVFRGVSKSSVDPPSELNTYNNYSSDEDFSFHAATRNNESNIASSVNMEVSNVNLRSNSKSSNHESYENSFLNKHQLDHNLSPIPAEFNSIESEATIHNDTSKSNNLHPCCSETTKGLPKYEVPCYVRLKRDPILDKRAMTFSSAVDSSEDECIVISEDSDIDESHSMLSSVKDNSCLSLDLSQNDQNKSAGIQKSQSDLNSNINNSQSCEDDEVDDCVFMCEMPRKVLDTNIKESNGEISSLSSGSLLCTSKSTSNSNTSDVEHPTNKQVSSTSVIEPSNTDLDEMNGKHLSNSEKTTDSTPICHEDGSKDIEEFNVQIVAVKSLVETNANSFKTHAPAKLNEIEIIDLSDDDDDSTENKNSKVINEVGTKDHSKNTVQEENIIPRNVEEIIHCERNIEICDSPTLPSEPHKPGSCKNPAAAEPNFPNPKIMEILSTINFDKIKEAINMTKLVNAVSKSNEAESVTSDCALPSLPRPTTICEKKVESEISINSEAFKERNSDVEDKRQDDIVINAEEAVSVNSLSNRLKRDDLQVKLPDSSIESSCISSPVNALESSSKITSLGNFRTTNRSLIEGKTDLVIDMNTKPTVNNSCIKENISSETLSSQSKTFQVTNADNRIVNISNGDPKNKTSLDSQQRSENPLHNYAKTNEVSKNTICNSSKVTEVFKNSVSNNERQPNSKIEILPLQAKISKEIKTSVPNNHNVLKHEKVNIKEITKREILESPSDDLDALATKFIQDLNPTGKSKNATSLINLYRTEYAKYMEIKNTEVNVSAGLKLLHENQVNKLLHLRSSIQNLAKHDPCFYKVLENCNSKATTSVIKSETEDKSEVKKISSQARSTNERKDSSIKHTEMEANPPLKLSSAKTSREELLRLMMNTKCAECGKPASCRCQGCAKVYYCSPQCGMLSWKQGHYAVCKR